MKKTILITGTSSGFGKLTTITLAAAGYNVIATMRNTQNKNANVAKELSRIPCVTVLEMDVADDDSVNNAIVKALKLYPAIDVVVNNAAVWGTGVTEAYSVAQQKRIFEVNYFSIVRMYNAVLPIMRKQESGLFINITSGASGFTIPYAVPYFATKMAVESLTEGMQEELRPFGIDNVSIQPGVFDTGIGQKEGINSDIPEVIAEYGENATIPMTRVFQALLGSMSKYDLDPQLIADGILNIIQMEPGNRPLRVPIDPIAEGTDIEFVEARAAIKKKWSAKYGS